MVEAGMRGRQDSGSADRPPSRPRSLEAAESLAKSRTDPAKKAQAEKASGTSLDANIEAGAPSTEVVDAAIDMDTNTDTDTDADTDTDTNGRWDAAIDMETNTDTDTDADTDMDTNENTNTHADTGMVEVEVETEADNEDHEAKVRAWVSPKAPGAVLKILRKSYRATVQLT